MVKMLFTILICGFLLWKIPQEFSKVNLRILNYMLSGLNFKILLEMEATERSEVHLLKRYQRYFSYVAALVFEQADAYAMTGFCLAKQGQIKQSISAYEQAASINPYAVWIYYNLGVLYLKQSNLDMAKQYFQKALSVPLEANIYFVTHSKIYADIIRHSPAINLEERVKQTYAMSYFLSNNLSNVPNKDLISPRIF